MSTFHKFIGLTSALVVILLTKEARAMGQQCAVDHEYELIACELQLATCLALNLPDICYAKARACTFQASQRAIFCKLVEIEELEESLIE